LISIFFYHVGSPFLTFAINYTLIPWFKSRSSKKNGDASWSQTLKRDFYRECYNGAN